MIIYNYLRRKKNFCFRPSTPIFDLLEHKYQDKWLQQRRQQELANRKEETQVKLILTKKEIFWYTGICLKYESGFFLHFNFEKFEFTSEVLNFLHFIISTVMQFIFAFSNQCMQGMKSFHFFNWNCTLYFISNITLLKLKCFEKYRIWLMIFLIRIRFSLRPGCHNQQGHTQ